MLEPVYIVGSRILFQKVDAAALLSDQGKAEEGLSIQDQVLGLVGLDQVVVINGLEPGQHVVPNVQYLFQGLSQSLFASDEQDVATKHKLLQTKDDLVGRDFISGQQGLKV